MRVRGVFAAAMVAGVLAMSGCGEAATPEPIDKSEGNAADRPDPDPKPAKQKSDDEKSDDDGKIVDKGDGSGPIDETSPEAAAKAEDLVVRYFDALNEATGTGDYSSVNPLFTEDCTACMSSKNYITSVYGDGGRIKGGTATDVQATAGETNTQNGHIQVEVELQASAWETLDASGNSVEGDSAKQERYEFFVSEEGGSWRIVAGSLQG